MHCLKMVRLSRLKQCVRPGQAERRANKPSHTPTSKVFCIMPTSRPSSKSQKCMGKFMKFAQSFSERRQELAPVSPPMPSENEWISNNWFPSPNTTPSLPLPPHIPSFFQNSLSFPHGAQGLLDVTGTGMVQRGLLANQSSMKTQTLNFFFLFAALRLKNSRIGGRWVRWGFPPFRKYISPESRPTNRTRVI